MKFALAVVCLMVVVAVQANLTKEQAEKVNTYHKDCAQETGVNVDLVTKARNGDFAEDDKLKEHLFCVAKKVGLLSAEGEIQIDVLQKTLGSVHSDGTAAQKLIEKCAVKKDTPQNTAFEIMKCYHPKPATHV